LKEKKIFMLAEEIYLTGIAKTGVLVTGTVLRQWFALSQTIHVAHLSMTQKQETKGT